MEFAPVPRREFARVLATGLSGYALGMTSEANAQETLEDKPKPLSVPALILAQIVSECPSEHWNEETLENVLGDIRADLSRGRILKSVPLTNADEPGPIFAAYRAPQQGPR